MVDKEEIWTTRKFNSLSAGMYGDFYICENWKRKGYHLAIRTFGSLGGNAEWETVKQLTDQEVIYALEAGITGWVKKPRIRVKANYVRN